MQSFADPRSLTGLMQNRKDSLILKQKGNYIPLLKHGESVQVNEERGYCCPRIAKSRSKSKNIAGTVPQEKLQKQEIYTEKRTDNCKSLSKQGLLICGLIRRINIP